MDGNKATYYGIDLSRGIAENQTQRKSNAVMMFVGPEYGWVCILEKSKTIQKFSLQCE